MRGPKSIATFREHTGDVQQDRIQEQTRQIASRVNALPFARGKIISVRFVSAVTKVVTHGLGVPARAMVVGVNYSKTSAGSAGVGEDFGVTDLDADNQTALVADSNCDVDILFYPSASKLIDATTGVGV